MQLAKNDSFAFGAGIDALPRLRKGEGGVPIGHGILALPRVGDVRVMTDGVFFRHQFAQTREADPHLGSEDHATEPVRLIVLEKGDEFVQPSLIKALGGNPHLGPGMVAVQVGGLLFQQREQRPGPRVTGIPARHEDGIHAGQLAEDLAPFTEGGRHCLRLGVIRVHRGIPKPDIQPIAGGEAGHAGHYFHGRPGKMGTIGVIIRAWRD